MTVSEATKIIVLLFARKEAKEKYLRAQEAVRAEESKASHFLGRPPVQRIRTPDGYLVITKELDVQEGGVLAPQANITYSYEPLKRDR